MWESASVTIFFFFAQVIREFVDGTDLETLIKNPSLCPAVRSPEKKMKVALGMLGIAV